MAKYGIKAQSSVKEAVHKKEEGLAAQRQIEEKSEEQETGDRDWLVRRRKKGAKVPRKKKSK